MKEQPILFSSEMVQAILDGRKTMTRQTMKPQPEYYPEAPHWRWKAKGPAANLGPFAVASGDKPSIFGAYVVGEKLWVRETWQLGTGDGKKMGINVQFKTEPWCVEVPAEHREAAYAAAKKIGYGGKWRPSIFMPRWASRITLEVSDVTVERLQDIGKDGRKAHDVLAEGITREAIERNQKWFHPDDAPAITFASLWNSINGKGSWESNPWVWALSFRRVTDADQLLARSER